MGTSKHFSVVRNQFSISCCGTQVFFLLFVISTCKPLFLRMGLLPWELHDLIERFIRTLGVRGDSSRMIGQGLETPEVTRRKVLNEIVKHSRIEDINMFIECLSAHLPTTAGANMNTAPTVAEEEHPEPAEGNPSSGIGKDEMEALRKVVLEIENRIITVELVVNQLFDIAAQMGRADMARYLVKSKGADVNQLQFGFTYLQGALVRGDERHVELLLELGADPNIGVSTHNYSPLVAGAQFGNPHCLKMLLEAGADAKTAIADCWRYIPEKNMSNMPDNYEIIMKLMLAAGANVNIHPSGLLTSTLPFMDILLFAAGEKYLSVQPLKQKALFFCPDDWDELDLKNQCRKVIRKHLLTLDLYTNLFMRIPRLGRTKDKSGLSHGLVEYLLYFQDLTIDWSQVSHTGKLPIHPDMEEYVLYHENKWV